MVKYIECLKEHLESITVSPEILIYCVDTKEGFYYQKSGDRAILTNIIRLESEDDRLALEPIDGNIYIVVNNNFAIYRYDSKWKVVLTEDHILHGDYTDEYNVATLYDDENPIAPVTLASMSFHMDGTDMETALETATDLIFKKIYTHPVYVDISYENQRTFEIPYPFLNYTLGINHMTVIYNNEVYNNNFTINGNRLMVNENVTLEKGKKLLFIFTYTSAINTNNILIDSDNLAPGSVTSNALAADVKFPAANLAEDDEHLTVTSEEKSKWNSKASTTIANEKTTGLMSALTYNEVQELKNTVNNTPGLKSGIARIMANTNSATVLDDFINEDCFVLVNTFVDSEGEIKASWSDGTLLITSTTTEPETLKINWLCVKNPS